MKKNKKENKKEKNLLWKILSLIIAIGLWYFVIQVENPSDTYVVQNVKIKVINQDVLFNEGLCISNVSNERMSITLSGKKTILGKIHNYEEQIVGIVDLSDYINGNTISKEDGTYFYVNVVLPDILKGYATIEKQNLNYLKVDVDSVKQDVKDVVVNVKSNLEDNYLFDSESIKVMPRKVEISGASNAVDSVVKVSANVNITSSKVESYEATLVAFDVNNKKVENISISPSSIQVDVPLLIQKKVKLNPNILKSLSDGYELEEIKIEPNEIYIAVNQNEFNTLPDSLSIPITLEEIEGEHRLIQKLDLSNKYFNVKGIENVSIAYKIKNINY